MYLDPGFGSMLIQLLVASIAAAAVMFGVFRSKIAAFFRKRKKGPDEGADEEDKDAE